MPFEIDPNDPRPIYVQIMDEIHRGVVAGTWRPGESLPSARNLAVSLRVNPHTVQKAYGELEREGTVVRRRGVGTFVRDGVLPAERRQLVARLARRAEREAHRSGVTVGELVRALEARSRSRGEVVREAG